MLMKPPVRFTRITKEVLDRNAGEIIKIRRLAEVEDGHVTAVSVEGVKLVVKDGVADVPERLVPRLAKEGWLAVGPSEAAVASGQSETVGAAAAGAGAQPAASQQAAGQGGEQGARQGGGTGKPR